MADDNLLSSLTGFSEGIRDVLVPYLLEKRKSRSRLEELEKEEELKRLREFGVLEKEEEIRKRREEESRSILEKEAELKRERERFPVSRYETLTGIKTGLPPEEFLTPLEIGYLQKRREEHYISPEEKEEKEREMLNLIRERAAARAEGVERVRPRKPTEFESTTGLYANRLIQSGGIINKLEGYVKRASAVGFATQEKLPKIATGLKSKQFQSLEQAQRNFLNAVLRRESGAVISPSEFEEGRKQYFPIPGDTEETILQKRENRDLVTKSFIRSAGEGFVPTEIERKKIQTNLTPFTRFSTQDKERLEFLRRKKDLGR